MFSGQFCSNPVFSTENPGANSGHATSGGTSETWHDTNQSGFHLTSAVSAAAAAMALSPSHVGYMNQEIYHQNQVSMYYVCTYAIKIQVSIVKSILRTFQGLKDLNLDPFYNFYG